MRNSTYIILFIIILSLFFSSCEKDQVVIHSNLSVQEENIASFYKSAVIECDLRSSATLSNILVEYTKSDWIDYQQVEVKKIADKHFAILTDLTPNTSYVFRYVVGNQFSTKMIERNSKITTTSQTSVPTVLTDTASNITKSSAKVQIYIIDDGGENITECGAVVGTSSQPTINDKKVLLSTNEIGIFTIELTDLSPETNYYVRTYAKNSKGISYGNSITFSTLKLPFENGHEYVDLGLSVKWATCNIGASIPEEYGGYYAWGETSTKEEQAGTGFASAPYEWSDYKYCLGQSYTLTKYCTDLSYAYITNVKDNKTKLDISDDAANVNWGGQWRMPTKSEMEELKSKCRWEWSEKNGIYGYIVWGVNANCIFLPSAGYINENSLESHSGRPGYYWTNNLYDSSPTHAYILYITESSVAIKGHERCFGLSIRPVCP